MKNSSPWHVHRFWLVRTVLVLAVTGLAEVAVVSLVQKPVLWVALIAGSIPLSLFFLVAFPLVRQQNSKST
jgi:hypothetical protein